MAIADFIIYPHKKAGTPGHCHRGCRSALPSLALVYRRQVILRAVAGEKRPDLSAFLWFV